MPKDSDDFDLVDRPRGILTREDRQYLLGELDRDLDANARAQRIYRIRQRLRNSVIDFTFFCHSVEKTRLAFQGESEGALDDNVGRGIISMFEYFQRVIAPDPERDDGFGSIWRIGAIRAIVNHYASQGISVLPHVAIDLDIEDRVPLSTVKSAFENGEGLFRWELHALLEADEITYQQYREAWDNAPGSEQESMRERRDSDKLQSE